MKNANRVIWGIILIAVGIIFALNALGITDIDLFFEGWWTFIIIIPSIVGLITDSDKTGNFVSLLIGVFLFLCCRDILDFGMMWKLIIPAVIIIIGIKFLLGEAFLREKNVPKSKITKNGFALFSGNEMKFDGEVFEGVELSAIFGGIDCDLRGAVINSDCVINASSVFGGIDIIVPDFVNVKVSSSSLFGGVSDEKHRHNKEGAPTLYINASAVFGGVEIK
ncbi:MAG: hypothetical protein IJ323_06350 [Clostridia bacterium]|nr:hypothetical protein [Clostridia bacterium]